MDRPQRNTRLCHKHHWIHSNRIIRTCCFFQRHTKVDFYGVAEAILRAHTQRTTTEMLNQKTYLEWSIGTRHQRHRSYLGNTGITDVGRDGCVSSISGSRSVWRAPLCEIRPVCVGTDHVFSFDRWEGEKRVGSFRFDPGWNAARGSRQSSFSIQVTFTRDVGSGAKPAAKCSGNYKQISTRIPPFPKYRQEGV